MLVSKIIKISQLTPQLIANNMSGCFSETLCSFLRKSMVDGATPSFYLKFWVKPTPLERNFRSIFARSASAVTPIEKYN